MEKALRQYTLKKHRLTPENLRRSLAGAAARAEDGIVNVMVSTPKGVHLPWKIDALWRSREGESGFDLCGANMDATGWMNGLVLTKPVKYDDDGYRHMAHCRINPAVISECNVSYLEKKARRLAQEVGIE